MKMKKYAMIVALFGLAILIGFLYRSPLKISSLEELNMTQENTKVITSGKVISERPWGNSKLLILDNKIELICDCPALINKNITAIGRIDLFNGKKRVNVLSYSIR